MGLKQDRRSCVFIDIFERIHHINRVLLLLIWSM